MLFFFGTSLSHTLPSSQKTSQNWNWTSETCCHLSITCPRSSREDSFRGASMSLCVLVRYHPYLLIHLVVSCSVCMPLTVAPGMESRDGEMSNHFKLWSDDYEVLSHFPQPKPFTPGTGR